MTGVLAMVVDGGHAMGAPVAWLIVAGRLQPVYDADRVTGPRIEAETVTELVEVAEATHTAGS